MSASAEQLAISQDSNVDSTFKHFEVVPVAPALGAMIEGLHLSELTDESAEELRRAVWQYGVVFARDQHLDPVQQKRVASYFAEDFEEHPFAKNLADEGHPEVFVIEQFASDSARARTTTDLWHHDVTGRTNPNLVSVIQAKEVPFGADTMWASAGASYDYLPNELKLLFLGLDIDHDLAYMAMRHDFGDASTAAEKLVKVGEVATHPAVIQHPFTGRLGTFIGNGHIKRVHGYTTDLSDLILKIANELPKLPELQVRHHWSPGDVAIWDNFGTLHYGVTGDLRSQTRLLHRVSVWSREIAPYLDREAAIRELMEGRV